MLHHCEHEVRYVREIDVKLRNCFKLCHMVYKISYTIWYDLRTVSLEVLHNIFRAVYHF